MNKFNISLFCILSIVIYSQSSCKKFVEISGPKNQLTTDAVFADSTDANAAILGIYINMYQGSSFTFGSGGLSFFPSLSADELLLSANDDTRSQFYNNQLLPTNYMNQSLYGDAYKFIYQANACIEGIKSSASLSEPYRNVSTAEARFLRAFFYFNVVNLYGGVPLVTSTDYNQTRTLGRSNPNLVYEQIIADLKFAQANLSQSPVSNSRANYYSATALLAKTYLYTKQFALASAEAGKVISSGRYTIVDDLNAVFLSTSSETIFSLKPVIPGQATIEGLSFVPSSTSAIPQYIITKNLYGHFEQGDLRETSWINSNNIAGTIYPYPYKYKIGRTSNAITEEDVVIRLAELYLIRAEARANLNDITGAQADLNVIRTRAGLKNTTAGDKAAVLLALEKERQTELFCEWGNRWYDLKRTNRAVEVLGPIKSNFNATSVLYPIPLSELNANSALVQNPGY